MRAADRIASRNRVYGLATRLDGAFLPAPPRAMFLERLLARVACRSTKRLRADVTREVAHALNIFNDMKG